MNWKQLERKLDRFVIHNLTLYLVGGQGLALVLSLATPGLLENMVFVPSAVLAGQWWRLLSFLFMPPFGNPFFAMFALYFLWFMGGSLENQWGAVRYNLYVLVAYLMTIGAAFAFPMGAATNLYITGSIFLAFAYLYPEFQILLFFVLPVKVKWLAALTWIGYVWRFIVGDWAERLLILAAIANFLLFFGRDLFYTVRHGHRKLRKQAGALATRDKPTHVCTTCGITDKTHSTMDFRYCTKCSPPTEYCEAHLRTHTHL